MFTSPSDMKLAFATRIVYQYVLCVTKIGICAFYLRVFQDKGSKRLVYLLLAFIAIPFIVIEAYYIFSCKPISAAWNPLLLADHCLPQMPSCFANTVLNVIADILVMAFLLPRISMLIFVSVKFKLTEIVSPQPAPRQKQTLIAVVSLGILVIIASIIRLYFLVNVDESADLSCKSNVSVGLGHS